MEDQELMAMLIDAARRSARGTEAIVRSSEQRAPRADVGALDPVAVGVLDVVPGVLEAVAAVEEHVGAIPAARQVRCLDQGAVQVRDTVQDLNGAAQLG